MTRCHLDWCIEPAVVLWMPPADLTHLTRTWKPTCEPHCRGIMRCRIGRFMPLFAGHSPGHSPKPSDSPIV